MHSVYKGLTTRSYRVWALLPDADGLYQKSRVMVAGIIIGEITTIGLQGNQARIDLRIKEEIKLYKNASIAKVGSGLLGDQVLSLLPGDVKTGPLKDGDQIKLLRKEGLMATLSEAAPNLSKLTDTLRDLSAGPEEKGRGSIRDIADSIRTLARSLNASVEQNQTRINEVMIAVEKITKVAASASQQNLGKVNEIVRNIRDVTDNLKRVSGQDKVIVEILQNVRAMTTEVRRVVEKQVGPGSDDLRRIVQRLDKTMGQVEQISSKINEGKGTVGRLINDRTLIDKVEGVVADASSLVKRVSLLRTEVSYRGDYMVLSSRFRHMLQVTIAPTPARYYTLALTDDPRGAATIIRRIKRSTDPTKPALIQEEDTELRDTFRFSALLNYRFGFAVVRGGIIENSGGVGADFLFWKDRIQIHADFFEFSFETLPRLRVSASLNLWMFHLTVGGDDLLNASRDFYVGVGLRFTDDDLKTILPFLAIPR